LDCLKEAIRVANAHGVAIDEDAFLHEMVQMYDRIAKEKPDSTSSMQRDVMQGQQSEMEDLIGSIMRLAKQKQVQIPVISVLYAALKPQDLLTRSKI